MKHADFLRALVQQSAVNFYVVTSDDEGLAILIPRTLAKMASAGDILVKDAAGLTVSAARTLAHEAGLSPRDGSTRTHIVLRRMERLQPNCVGPLLMAAEESPFARFIFIGGRIPARAATLASRSTVVHLPFLNRRSVMGNLQALGLDAKLADEEGHYDGTLGGTSRNLKQRADRAKILEALGRGLDGYEDLAGLADSPAFERTLEPLLRPEEVAFLRREGSEDRRRLVAFLALTRPTEGRGR